MNEAERGFEIRPEASAEHCRDSEKPGFAGEDNKSALVRRLFSGSRWAGQPVPDGET